RLLLNGEPFANQLFKACELFIKLRFAVQLYRRERIRKSLMRQEYFFMSLYHPRHSPFRPSYRDGSRDRRVPGLVPSRNRVEKATRIATPSSRDDHRRGPAANS